MSDDTTTGDEEPREDAALPDASEELAEEFEEELEYAAESEEAEAKGEKRPNFFVRIYRGQTSFDFIGNRRWWFGVSAIIILVGILKIFKEMRLGTYDDAELEHQLNQRGLMNRFLGPLARRIDTPWKMYPIGFLFGLGFDTATEVALLVLAGTAVVGGLPFYAILSLPILFAAGMSLFDTMDGCFMNFAYDWAFSKPIRKVYYNITITGLSVFVALFIGGIEAFGLLGQDAHLGGGFWSFLENFDINKAGFVIVGVFVVTWVVALAVWRFANIEQRWQPALASEEPAPPEP